MSITVAKNIAIDSGRPNTKRLFVGKYVRYRGQWIIHYHVHEHYRRISQGGYGVRAPVLDLAEHLGIEQVYCYNADADETISAAVATLRRFGVEGKPDKYGQTLNLSEMYWSDPIPGKIATQPSWVPNSALEVVPAEGLGSLV